MFLFKKKKNTDARQKVRENSPEVVAAREYLDKTHPTLTGRDSPIATMCGHKPFNYLECSKNGEYTRYHFCEGSDKRIIYIVLCDEERKKMIQLFNDTMKENVEYYEGEFIYKDSLKGMFVGEEVKHCFFSCCRNEVAFMSDDGDVEFSPILQSEDMEY